MELPHLGEQCSDKSCNKLDYLPMRCDACNELFCKDHLMYDDHSCSSKYKKDVQVPVCPLCNAPVPVARGTVPDLAVSAHIDQDCKQKTKEKVFTNRCNKTKCKKKELVKIICDSCKLNFCLTHRHPKDHDCKGPSSASQLAASAAASRAAKSSSNNPSAPSTQSKITNFFSGPFRSEQPSRAPVAATSRSTAAFQQQNMTEDEALAAALAASMADVPSQPQTFNLPTSGLSQEEQDRMLAQALQDHDCKGPSSASQLAASAAASRAAKSSSNNPSAPSTQSKITNFFSGPFRSEQPSRAPVAATSRSTAAFQQQNMTEDEALAAALAASMADVPSQPQTFNLPTSGLSQEEQDRMLAQALQESEASAATRRRPTPTSAESSNCTIS